MQIAVRTERPSAGLTSRLFRGLDLLDHVIKVRPFPGLELGMEQFSIGPDLESSALGWNESERRNAFAKFKNFGRQTDGLRRVISNDAVFD